jgi:hypothetical protein
MEEEETALLLLYEENYGTIDEYFIDSVWIFLHKNL